MPLYGPLNPIAVHDCTTGKNSNKGKSASHHQHETACTFSLGNPLQASFLTYLMSYSDSSSSSGWSSCSTRGWSTGKTKVSTTPSPCHLTPPINRLDLWPRKSVLDFAEKLNEFTQDLIECAPARKQRKPEARAKRLPPPVEAVIAEGVEYSDEVELCEADILKKTYSFNRV